MDTILENVADRDEQSNYENNELSVVLTINIARVFKNIILHQVIIFCVLYMPTLP